MAWRKKNLFSKSLGQKKKKNDLEKNWEKIPEKYIDFFWKMAHKKILEHCKKNGFWPFFFLSNFFANVKTGITSTRELKKSKNHFLTKSEEIGKAGTHLKKKQK